MGSYTWPIEQLIILLPAFMGGERGEKFLKKKEWGEAIQKVRQEKNLTQLELAKKTNLSVDSIRLIEQSGHIPHLTAIYKIAEALGLSINKILLMIGIDLMAADIFGDSKR